MGVPWNTQTVTPIPKLKPKCSCVETSRVKTFLIRDLELGQRRTKRIFTVDTCPPTVDKIKLNCHKMAIEINKAHKYAFDIFLASVVLSRSAFSTTNHQTNYDKPRNNSKQNQQSYLVWDFSDCTPCHQQASE